MILTAGTKIPDFPYITKSGKHESFLRDFASKRTVLVFHRFIDCRICRLALYDATQIYKELSEVGYEIVFVVQSSAEDYERYAEQLKIPFTVICDPEEHLYQLFEVPLAANIEQLDEGNRLISELKRAEMLGFPPGIKKGNQLQLPAAVVLSSDGTVVCSEYAKTVWLSDLRILVKSAN